MARKQQADRQHRWLSQVEVTGVVLSEPVLAEMAPAGFSWIPGSKLAAFRKAREVRNLPRGMVGGDPQQEWIRFIIEDLLELKPRFWRVGAEIPTSLVVQLPLVGDMLRPSRVLMDRDKPVLVMIDVPEGQSLDRPWTQDGRGWRASPTTKMERLLRETGVELGLVTNGEAWRVVVASPSETASWITWTAETWAQAPSTLTAFVELLSAARFLAGRPEDTLLGLVRKSRERQLDVADQLGEQARQALSVFVHALDQADSEVAGALLAGRSVAETLEASSVFLMRLIFMLYAEENGLLPHGSAAYDRAYGILHLLTELEARHRIAPGELRSTYEAYGRILATARLVYEGSPDSEINLAPHGGRLFDPAAFPLLEGRSLNGQKTLPYAGPPRISDDAIRAILRSLKYARANGGAPQLVSYRTLAVEQIGYMYEGLLTRELARAGDEPLVLLEASDPSVLPSLPLERFRCLSETELAAEVAELIGRPVEGVLNRLQSEPKPRLLEEVKSILGAESEQTVRRVACLARARGAVRAGGLYVTTSATRSMQGAHYTPPTLTEPVVRQTLEPLVYRCVDGKPGQLKEPRELRSSKEILQLRVCDPAMGSGAFLVQVVRYLGDRLAETWDRAARDAMCPLSLPYAEPSKGGPEEHLMPASAEDRRLEAYRYVSGHCIYGVDRSQLAVEMAKLSLWLVTLSAGRRFTFLDHSLRYGDSLVGVSFEQISRWSLRDQAPTLPLLDNLVSEAVHNAVKARFTISNLSGSEDEGTKRAALQDADQSAAEVKLLGDLLVGAAYRGRRDRERVRLREQARELGLSLKQAEVKRRAERLAEDMLDGQPTFHWQIEFPEVFAQEGFDAIVGNPPFLGGRKLRRAVGDHFTELLPQLHPGASLNADLCAFFFLTTYKLVRNGGRLGLIATNSIGEGDTRETGLQRIVQAGGRITSAIRQMQWPGEATVAISIVWITKGDWYGPITLDGKDAPQLSTFLRAEEPKVQPRRLRANAQLCFQGSVLASSGFIIDQAERNRLVAMDPRNVDIVMPLYTGQDITTSPSQSPRRWCINFFDWPLDKAESYPEPLRVVSERVLPDKMEKASKGYMTYWWQHWRPRTALYKAVSSLERVLACSLVSTRWCVSFIEKGAVYTHACGIFASDDFGMLGMLQSGFHEAWKDAYGSKLRNDSRYTPSDCFETFPFPQQNPRLLSQKLADISFEYDVHRRELMSRRKIGLTATYNLFHSQTCNDHDIEILRDLHRRLDEAVAAEYGWSDVNLAYGWHHEGQSCRWTWSQAARTTVLDRLHSLNLSRSAGENQSAQHDTPDDDSKPRPASGRIIRNARVRNL